MKIGNFETVYVEPGAAKLLHHGKVVFDPTGMLYAPLKGMSPEEAARVERDTLIAMFLAEIHICFPVNFE